MAPRGKLTFKESASPLTVQAVRAAEQLGLRLESVGGLTIWEAHPGFVHQTAVDRIRAGLSGPKRRAKGGCDCIHVADVYIRFSDGSLKRPDIAIFCKPPRIADDGELVLSVPDAVVEVISKGYETKDLELAPAFYLAQGVQDVVTFNPITKAIVHTHKAGSATYKSKKKLALECGCSLTV